MPIARNRRKTPPRFPTETPDHEEIRILRRLQRRSFVSSGHVFVRSLSWQTLEFHLVQNRAKKTTVA
eukprot:COSAG06_NODE_39269_length_414_cov_1.285714_1_plen_66_part_01